VVERVLENKFKKISRTLGQGLTGAASAFLASNNRYIPKNIQKIGRLIKRFAT